jgi:hypothetical protein
MSAADKAKTRNEQDKGAIQKAFGAQPSSTLRRTAASADMHGDCSR